MTISFTPPTSIVQFTLLEGKAPTRRLVVVDIENIAGGAVTAAAKATEARNAIEHAVEIGPSDHVVLGVGPCSLLGAYLGWSGAPRHVMRAGPDGADLALLEVLDSEQVEKRFTHVVIVSGDGIFAASAARLSRCGVHVTVAARARGLAKRLRLAASTVVLLSDSVSHLGGAA